jgi:hypothetical protein
MKPTTIALLILGAAVVAAYALSRRAPSSAAGSTSNVAGFQLGAPRAQHSAGDWSPPDYSDELTLAGLNTAGRFLAGLL